MQLELQEDSFSQLLEGAVKQTSGIRVIREQLLPKPDAEKVVTQEELSGVSQGGGGGEHAEAQGSGHGGAGGGHLGGHLERFLVGS